MQTQLTSLSNKYDDKEPLLLQYARDLIHKTPLNISNNGLKNYFYIKLKNDREVKKLQLSNYEYELLSTYLQLLEKKERDRTKEINDFVTQANIQRITEEKSREYFNDLIRTSPLFRGVAQDNLQIYTDYAIDNYNKIKQQETSPDVTSDSAVDDGAGPAMGDGDGLGEGEGEEEKIPIGDEEGDGEDITSSDKDETSTATEKIDGTSTPDNPIIVDFSRDSTPDSSKTVTTPGRKISLTNKFQDNIYKLKNLVESNPYLTLLLLAVITLAFIITTIVLTTTSPKPDTSSPDKCDDQTSGGGGGGGGTTTTIIVKKVDESMVSGSIAETTQLNNSYAILYDNKNVDYRHSYYANLNVTTMQLWYPHLNKLYYIVLGIYALFLLIFQSTTSWLSKLQSFLVVVIVTNVYVLKFIVSLLIVCYTWLTVNLPKFFFY